MPSIDTAPSLERPLAMPVGTLGRILVRDWAIIAVAAVLGLGGGLIGSWVSPAPYQATAYQLVTIPSAPTSNATATPSASATPTQMPTSVSGMGVGVLGTQLAITRAMAYPEFIHAEQILSLVQRDAAPTMSLSQLSELITADNPLGTALVRVTAKAPTAAQAQAMANAAATQLAAYANAAENTTGKAEVALTTVGMAGLPTSPAEPRSLIWGTLGLVTGLVAAISFLLIRETARFMRPRRRGTAANAS